MGLKEGGGFREQSIQNRHPWGPHAERSLGFVGSQLCGLSETYWGVTVTNAVVLDQPWPHLDAADATSVPRSCRWRMSHASLPGAAAHWSRMTMPLAHTLSPTGLHLLLVTVPLKRSVNSANTVCCLCHSKRTMGSLAKAGPWGKSHKCQDRRILQPLVLCQDTRSDGPGANGRKAEDPHGKESASVDGGRKDQVRESTWGSSPHPTPGSDLQQRLAEPSEPFQRQGRAR